MTEWILLLLQKSQIKAVSVTCLTDPAYSLLNYSGIHSAAYSDVFSVVSCAKRRKAILLHTISFRLAYILLDINSTVKQSYKLEILRKLGSWEPVNHEYSLNELFLKSCYSQYSIMCLETDWIMEF